jgi:hypothetical protein
VATIEILATTAAALIACVAGFHIALAAGVPWGAAAYGGRARQKNGTLSIRYRTTSAISVVVLAAAGCLILVAGSVIGQGPLPSGLPKVGIWVLAALFALNTLVNLRGQHPVERWGASAVTVTLAVLCTVIALGP